jgi:hypothetical protein
MGWFSKKPAKPAMTSAERVHERAERARKVLKIWSTATVPPNPNDVIPTVLTVVMDGWTPANIEATAKNGVSAEDLTKITGLLIENMLYGTVYPADCAAVLAQTCREKWASQR